MVEFRLLSERYVRALQSIQTCTGCLGELHHGQSAYRRVYLIEGDLVSEYQCEACSNAWGEGSRAG